MQMNSHVQTGRSCSNYRRDFAKNTAIGLRAMTSVQGTSVCVKCVLILTYCFLFVFFPLGRIGFSSSIVVGDFKMTLYSSKKRREEKREENKHRLKLSNKNRVRIGK